MLALTCERARLQDGERDPRARLRLGLADAVDGRALPDAPASPRCRTRARRSNSSTRAPPSAASRNVEVRHLRRERARLSGRQRRFDRVVSVEMFEHMRNYETLLARIAGWLEPGGTLFVHIFTHRRYAYPFEVRERRATGWRATSSPAASCRATTCCSTSSATCGSREHWRVDGTHYQKTAEAWLANMDRERDRVLPVLEATYGAAAGAPLVGLLAGVLHVLRRTVRLPRRPRVDRVALPVRAPLTIARRYRAVSVLRGVAYHTPDNSAGNALQGLRSCSAWLQPRPPNPRWRRRPRQPRAVPAPTTARSRCTHRGRRRVQPAVRGGPVRGGGRRRRARSSSSPSRRARRGRRSCRWR